MAVEDRLTENIEDPFKEVISYEINPDRIA